MVSPLDSYKILGQVAPDGTGVTDLYDVPLPATETAGSTLVAPKIVFVQPQTLVTSIIVCDIDATNRTFDIILQAVADGSIDNSEYLFKSMPIAASETKILSLGLTLGAGNIIKVKSSSADALSYTAMGIEVT